MPKNQNGQKRPVNSKNTSNGSIFRGSQNKQSGFGKTENQKSSQIVATYDYQDEHGKLLHQVCRMEPKTFRQRKPNGNGGWSWSVNGVRQVPYRLPEVLANPSKTVFTTEGEKVADRLTKLGLVATCNSGGAGKWRSEFAAHFENRDVVVIPDNDAPGRKHANQVAASLFSTAKSVRVLELPNLEEKGDVSDWFGQGGTVEQLRTLYKSTDTWTPESVPWGEIDSLDERQLPEFPVDALPNVLRQWVLEESCATQTPLDLAALLSLAVCSASIARRVDCQPRQGWREPVNLYAAVLLDPANRKSAVLSDAIKPLEELESELVEQSKVEVARAFSERRQLELALKNAEKKASQGDSQARHEAGEIAEQLATTPTPTQPCLIVDDATEEVLGKIIAEQGGRIASLSAEGGVFDLMAGKYAKNGGTNFNCYLKFHAGENPRSDRLSRESVRVDRPALTCGFAIQPHVIKGLADNPAFRGRGLLARFLYAAPRSWIGHREIDPPAMSDSTRTAYHNLIRDMAGFAGEITLEFTPGAQSLLKAWESEIEGMLADGGELERMRDWGGKLAGATIRLAAILHCVKQGGPVGQINETTLATAIQIARYLVPHAEVTLGMMSAQDDPTGDDARYLLRWIHRHAKCEFKKSEAQQHGKHRFPRADDIDEALVELVRRNYLRQLPSEPPRPGRPSSPSFLVNPAILKNENTEKRPGYSKNHPKPIERASLQNNQGAFEQTENQSDVEWV